MGAVALKRYEPVEEAIAGGYIGRKVKHFYGPMCGEEYGVIIGVVYSQWGVGLITKLESGRLTTFSGFSANGVGVYLLEG